MAAPAASASKVFVVDIGADELNVKVDKTKKKAVVTSGQLKGVKLTYNSKKDKLTSNDVAKELFKKTAFLQKFNPAITNLCKEKIAAAKLAKQGVVPAVVLGAAPKVFSVEFKAKEFSLKVKKGDVKATTRQFKGAEFIYKGKTATLELNKQAKKLCEKVKFLAEFKPFIVDLCREKLAAAKPAQRS